MTRRGRLTLFGAGGVCLLAVLTVGVTGLPRFGDSHQVVGLTIDHVEPGLRRATDIVTSLNFDIRAFDTLGEEFILFGSVVGVGLLLRQMRDEGEQREPGSLDDHRFAGASESLRATSLLMIPLLVALAGYIILHGALTPGGGFQGGIVLAAGPLVIMLAGRYLTLRRLSPEWALDSIEAFGAAGYVLIGLGGLIFAGTYLRNFLPLGTPDELLSAGMMPLNSIAVGLEVSGAFLLTWTQFLDQSLMSKPTGGAEE